MWVFNAIAALCFFFALAGAEVPSSCRRTVTVIPTITAVDCTCPAITSTPIFPTSAVTSSSYYYYNTSITSVSSYYNSSTSSPISSYSNSSATSSVSSSASSSILPACLSLSSSTLPSSAGAATPTAQPLCTDDSADGTNITATECALNAQRNYALDCGTYFLFDNSGLRRRHVNSNSGHNNQAHQHQIAKRAAPVDVLPYDTYSITDCLNGCVSANAGKNVLAVNYRPQRDVPSSTSSPSSTTSDMVVLTSSSGEATPIPTTPSFSSSSSSSSSDVSSSPSSSLSSSTAIPSYACTPIEALKNADFSTINSSTGEFPPWTTSRSSDVSIYPDNSEIIFNFTWPTPSLPPLSAQLSQLFTPSLPSGSSYTYSVSLNYTISPAASCSGYIEIGSTATSMGLLVASGESMLKMFSASSVFEQDATAFTLSIYCASTAEGAAAVFGFGGLGVRFLPPGVEETCMTVDFFDFDVLVFVFGGFFVDVFIDGFVVLFFNLFVGGLIAFSVKLCTLFFVGSLVDFSVKRFVVGLFFRIVIGLFFRIGVNDFFDILIGVVHSDPSGH
ncbi:hypothetical protein K402DRAFT_451194 [Aulographum hederae CBS 113979]|uniref:Uncharacterized protein n=1 Tax=Aulographum hederae CBS 113979 TaxID=1176131 RepID=A0A6G1HCH0_9PEZI|nr:hypothetical protein K402DRAFT_451194 [Aulographum hederae CBS 113979]